MEAEATGHVATPCEVVVCLRRRADKSATESSSSANRGKKRGGDHDVIPRQEPKRRQHNGHSDSTLAPKPEIEKGSDVSKPDETVAISNTVCSQVRRSQRLGAGAGVSQLQSGRGGIRPTRRGVKRSHMASRHQVCRG